MFKAAYGEKEGYVPVPIDIWGVTIDPNGTKNAKTSVVLMKWLRARYARSLRGVCTDAHVL